MVSIHEITHALAFAPELFDLFKKPNGLPYSDDEITKEIYFPNREKWVTVLTLPTVVSKAREIFGCENLEGIELEDYGGSGSAGSHWDMRILPGDYMSPQLSFESVFSAITLALFQDSGWYDVNFDYSQQILWGHKAGCEWLEDKCFRDENPKFSGFCKPSNRTGCDVYHLSESFCASKLVNNIPTNEQYFNDPDLGGSVSYADFCPYMYPFSNRKCRELSSLSYPKYYGESVGVNSRCVESTLLNKKYKFSPEIKGNCYEVINCTYTYATLRVGDQEVNCPFDGGNITIKGYNGVLICPNSDVLCSEKPCFHACSGQGKCINGKCHCNQGFEGDDCTPGCELTCKSCKGPGKFNCSSCWEGADLIDGACSCRPGTEFSYYKKICVESPKVSFSVNSEKLIVITLLYLFF
ncbi:unnamed protein product [Blepharisma stoltei]|uniref:EGF-like domain-containing protein n=1 Tax=Blepharisma stoltei TaxID=1481888 RepID=A0AAU9IZV0_9CILI|nr:unnamed protein product [Blepharisma stoltei]